VIGKSSDYILNEANMTQNIVPGQEYKFKIKARNIYGWAELYSDPVSVFAAEEPGQMDPPIVEHIHQDTLHPASIKISWTTPDSNSNFVSAYEVLIYGYPGRNTDTFTTREYFTTPECDASTEPVIS
jgi:hypothetical protein